MDVSVTTAATVPVRLYFYVTTNTLKAPSVQQRHFSPPVTSLHALISEKQHLTVFLWNTNVPGGGDKREGQK